jgi:hypothetical protein
MTELWDIAPCGLTEIDGHFFHPDDGGSKHLLNVDQFLRAYTTKHPTRACHLHSVISFMTTDLYMSAKNEHQCQRRMRCTVVRNALTGTASVNIVYY